MLHGMPAPARLTGRGHLRLFLLGTFAWVVFWLAGLPDYYQQYSSVALVWFEIVLFLASVVLAHAVLRRVRHERRIAISCWIAFYFTVPLAVYDWLYCGLYLGAGLSFLWRYWYLTTYYVIPWPLLPGIALLLNRRRPALDVTS
jgi:hypothetical protein